MTIYIICWNVTTIHTNFGHGPVFDHVSCASSPKLLLAGIAPGVTSYRTPAILVR
ncbi:MAG TPA: hypothetical protein VFN23_12625 [Ktedonobacteraceae bacterium]|nr:hypothetical protein [Ktedonobacteraceae bacterium]